MVSRVKYLMTGFLVCFPLFGKNTTPVHLNSTFGLPATDLSMLSGFKISTLCSMITKFLLLLMESVFRCPNNARWSLKSKISIMHHQLQSLDVDKSTFLLMIWEQQLSMKVGASCEPLCVVRTKQTL